MGLHSVKCAATIDEMFAAQGCREASARGCRPGLSLLAGNPVAQSLCSRGILSGDTASANRIHACRVLIDGRGGTKMR